MTAMKVAIAQMGEDIPSDDGYVPLRYGRLAEDLVARGSQVVRITPTFSHFRKLNREPGIQWSDSEGEHVLVRTGGYQSSFDPKRVLFFAQFVKGVAAELRARRDDIDVVLLGVPPPSIVAAARGAVGSSCPIIADVRDLWPEAFAVGRPRLMPAAGVGGQVLSKELSLASAITAVTSTMLDWAPDIDRPKTVIPIGLRPRTPQADVLPKDGTPLQACFLSNHSHGYDFVPVLKAWKRYVEGLGANGHLARLAFIGVEPTGETAQQLVESLPSVEYVGRVTPDRLTAVLSEFDVGLAPATPEWELSVGNKVFDYLSIGLFMMHSVAPIETEPMDRQGLSMRCELTEEDWTSAFGRFDTAALEQLRASRQDRISTADRLFGRTATSHAFIDLIDELAGEEARQS